jgi:hypothetical protein
MMESPGGINCWFEPATTKDVRQEEESLRVQLTDVPWLIPETSSSYVSSVTETCHLDAVFPSSLTLYLSP